MIGRKNKREIISLVISENVGQQNIPGQNRTEPKIDRPGSTRQLPCGEQDGGGERGNRELWTEQQQQVHIKKPQQGEDK